MVLGTADLDVALGLELLVEVKGEGGVEGGSVREAAAGARDRLFGVVTGVGDIVAEDRERVGWAAGRGEASGSRG